MARAPQQVLTLVRMALLGGVLMFGGVAYAVTRNAEPAITRDARASLSIVGMVVWGVALAGLVGMRLALRERVEGGRDTQLPLIAWALGEAPALFGGVFALLTGRWDLYVAGVVALLAAFALFPVPTRA